jgi:hypothetical protein
VNNPAVRYATWGPNRKKSVSSALANPTEPRRDRRLATRKVNGRSTKPPSINKLEYASLD